MEVAAVVVEVQVRGKVIKVNLHKTAEAQAPDLLLMVRGLDELEILIRGDEEVFGSARRQSLSSDVTGLARAGRLEVGARYCSGTQSSRVLCECHQ
ncbi:hypothetical protein N8637_00550, partial [Verrucomicrobia bacterium]|nr:hypothetical protein [Verrucomicrobiota bacterium]